MDTENTQSRSSNDNQNFGQQGGLRAHEVSQIEPFCEPIGWKASQVYEASSAHNLETQIQATEETMKSTWTRHKWLKELMGRHKMTSTGRPNKT